MNWEFYFKRRGLNLQKFLEGTSNLKEGIEKFSLKRLSLPPLEDLTNHYTQLENSLKQSVSTDEQNQQVLETLPQVFAATEPETPKKKTAIKQASSKSQVDDFQE